MTNPTDKSEDQKISYPVWEFNYKPESFVHESWLSNLPNAELLQKLIAEDSNSKKSTRLSHHLMNQLGFDGKFYFEFSDPITKLALWKTEDIQRLVYYVGILFYFDEIRHKITKADVNKFRSELGSELYDFALNNAPNLKNKQLKQVKLPVTMPIRQKILTAGLISLFTAMKGYPLPLLKRLVVKLPRKWFDVYLHYSTKNKIPGGSFGNIAVIELIMNELKVSKNNNNNQGGV
jgi:hypothetical protein